MNFPEPVVVWVTAPFQDQRACKLGGLSYKNGNCLSSISMLVNAPVRLCLACKLN